MAITKMKAITIAGKIHDFERVVGQYVYGKDIALENAALVLGSKKKLHSFTDGVHYENIVKTAGDIITLAGIDTKKYSGEDSEMSLDEMKEFLDGINARIENEKKRADEIKEQIEANNKVKQSLDRMQELDVDLGKLFAMEFVQFRYGHLPRSGYRMLETYLYDMNIIFVKTGQDEQNVWGLYFAPATQIQRTEEIFTSLYFVPQQLPEDMSGTPEQIQAQIVLENKALSDKIAELGKETKKQISDSEKVISEVYNTASKRQKFNEVRAAAVHSHDFFYIVGWMSEKDAKALDKEMSKDESIVLFYSEDAENLKSIIKPPTKLKNNMVFRPFEMFVNMYGLPSYNEIDPTPLLAVTYILFFGMMFGDLGQSAIFVVLGFLLYKLKNIKLMQIVGICGISGMIFGILYGSVFGNENIIHGILPPMENIQTLLISTVAMGAVVIVLSMFLNIKNAAANKDYPAMIFGQNGISGLVFYVSMLGLVLNMVLSLGLPSKLFVVLMIAAFVCIFMQEPLGDLLKGKKQWLPKDPMFYVQSLFEMVEVLLSYFSNTISFLRVGAFAIVHVGMMMAVQMLAGNGGVTTVIVTILGNIVVMVLEGLVVGIQVLRLEYYEMFSRYFTGSGKPFVSIKDK